MATVALEVRAAFMLGGGNIPMLDAPEAASMNDAKGTPVKDNGSGYLDTITVDDNLSLIVGFTTEAGHDSSSAGDDNLSFIPALPNVVFEITLEDESNNDHVLAATDMWEKFALQKDTTNDRWFLDENDIAAGEAAMKVIGFKDAAGTTKGRVYAVFLNEATIWSATLT